MRNSVRLAHLKQSPILLEDILILNKGSQKNKLIDLY